MKLNYLIILTFFLFGLGCRNKQNDPERFNFETIEFSSYYWTRYIDHDNMNGPEYLVCEFYAKIDESGKCLLFAYQNIPQPKNRYYSFKCDSLIVQKVLLSAFDLNYQKIDSINKIPDIPHDKKKAPNIYDGPTMKMKISYSNSVPKFFSFINNSQYSTEILPFLELYNYLKSKVIEQDMQICSDSIEIERSKLAFIIVAAKYDRFHRSNHDSISRVLHNRSIITIEDSN